MRKREGRPGSDPLGYTLLLAAALHGAVILGVGFTPEPQEREVAVRRSLRVVVTRPQPEADEPADTVEPAMEPPPPQRAAAEPPPPAPEPEPQAATPVEPTPAPKLVAQTSQQKAAAAKPKPVEKPKSKPTPKKRVTAAQLMASRSDEIARLNQELERKSTAYASRPRRKAISASTTEYKYAAYLEAWRRKVERIGNLNYPDEARRKKLYGNLVLHVAVRTDGSIADIRVLHSSGEEVLDQAAVRIVELSAPFAPFPKDIRAETDILDITRTWQFLSSNRLGWEK